MVWLKALVILAITLQTGSRGYCAEVFEAIVPQRGGTEVSLDPSESTIEEAGSGRAVDSEVRLTRPEEAQARRAHEDILDDPQYAQVEGAQVLKASMASPATRSPASAKVTPPSKEDKAKSTAKSEVEKSAGATQSKTKNIDRLVAELNVSPIPVRDELNLRELASRPGSLGLSSENMGFSGVVQEVSLIASEQGFFPSHIVVNQGTAVKIYLSTPGQLTLCFMNDQFGLQKGITPGQVQEITFMPNRTGLFRFYCPIRGLEGKLTVRAPATVDKARAPASTVEPE